MKRTLALSTGLVAVLGISISALLYRGVSLGFASALIERQATQLLGRQITIGEPVYLRIRSDITLSAGDIRMRNLPWAETADLLDTGSLRLIIDLRSLLWGPIIIEDLLLQDTAVSLATDKDGNSNLPDIPSERESEDPDSPSSQQPLPLILRHAQINNLHVTRQVHGNEEPLNLVITSLAQRARSVDSLELHASGTLQDRPWTFEHSGSGVDTLISGLNLSGSFSGSLAELALSGEYDLPDTKALRDLSLHARAEGSLPPRVAALSPLLDAETPITINLDVTDIDPGLNIDLIVDLENLDAHLTGTIAEPATGDGLDLSLIFDTRSLPRLAAALNLGPSAEYPLTVNLRATRKGSDIQLRDVEIQAGPHRVAGEVLLPLFPRTDNADITLTASGPDFSFYQRLLKLPDNLARPYRADATLVANLNGAETVDARFDLGDISGSVSGRLGDSPRYIGSDLHLELRAPSVSAIGKSLELELPDSALTLTADLSVADDAIVTVSAARANAYGTHALLSGTLNSFLSLDNIRLSAEVVANSLATTSAQLGLQPLGDIPAAMRFEIAGSPDKLAFDQLRLDAGGLRLQSQRGALQLRDGVFDSDLQLAVNVEGLPELLGSYASEAMGKHSYRLLLSPRLSGEVFSLSIDEFSGPGVSGSARFQGAMDFQLDARTKLEADLRFDAIGELLPEIHGYTPPSQPLMLSARTSGRSRLGLISAELRDAEGLRLEAQLTLPGDGGAGPTELHLQGSGEDLRVLGSYSAFPEGALPYAMDLDLRFDDEQIDINAKRLEIAGTELNGSATLLGDKALRANLQIPRGELERWIPDKREGDTSGKAAAREKSSRLIPDLPLPLDLLDTYQIDLSLNTGPLGISDPFFDELSLIDALSLNFGSGNGKAQLSVDQLVGIRGVLSGEVLIARRQNTADVNVDLSVKDFPVALTSTARSLDTLPQHDARLVAKAQGARLQALAGSLNGELLVTGGAGALNGMAMSFATESFVAQLFNALLPALNNQDTETKVECTVLGVTADNGVVSLTPGFVFRSQRVDLSARGEIDLRDESLAIRFDNQARQGLGLSAASLVNPYVQITGSLSKPKLGLDVASSAIAGGAAVASGGLTVLAKPLYGRFLNRKNPCDTALERWAERPETIARESTR